MITQFSSKDITFLTCCQIRATVIKLVFKDEILLILYWVHNLWHCTSFCPKILYYFSFINHTVSDDTFLNFTEIKHFFYINIITTHFLLTVLRLRANWYLYFFRIRNVACQFRRLGSACKWIRVNFVSLCLHYFDSWVYTLCIFNTLSSACLWTLFKVQSRKYWTTS